MQEVFDFLKEAKTFFIATHDGDKPKVRPFGFWMEYESKLYFSTSNQKEVCKQLAANPYFEICCLCNGDQWMRVQGRAVFDPHLDAKKRALEVMPSLLHIYKTPDNPIFEVFYVAEGQATFYSFHNEPRTVAL